MSVIHKQKGSLGPWINAYSSLANKRKTYPPNLDLVDIDANGRNYLVMAEFSNIISSFKQTTVDWQYELKGSPSAVTHFNVKDKSEKIIPVIAVAVDKCIYMYKLRNRYGRFDFESINMTDDEYTLWKSYTGEAEGINTFLMGLNQLKSSGVKLSYLSINILMLETLKEQLEFFENAKDTPHYSYDTPTCLSYIYSVSDIPGSTSQLVTGTENKHLIILNSVGNGVKEKYDLPDVPYRLITKGVIANNNYSIYILMRNNVLAIFHAGKITESVNLDGTPFELKRIDDKLILGFAEGRIIMYSSSTLGVLKTLIMPSPISAIETLYFEKLRTYKGFIVSLENKELRMYGVNGNTLLSNVSLDDQPSALVFGKIDSEEGCLVITYRNIGIQVKILQRKFFSQSSRMESVEQESTFKPPAKSQLFKEQLENDKERALDIYQNYQKDVLKIKNIVDEHYLKLLDKGMISATNTKSVKIFADVDGLGPEFLIILSLTNESNDAMIGLCLSLHFDSTIYELLGPLPEISCLLPYRVFKTTFRIRNNSTVGANDSIKVSVFEKKAAVPLSGIIIAMPISELPEM